MDAPATLDTLRRLAAAGGPLIAFDGSPERAEGAPEERALRRDAYVAALPSRGLCVRGSQVWTWRADAPGEWRPRPGGHDDLWASVAELHAHAQSPPVDSAAGGTDVPTSAFPHGVAGLVAYDAGRHIEHLDETARDDLRLPEIVLFRFDAVVHVPAEGAPRIEAHEPGARQRLSAALAAPPVPPHGGAVGPVAPKMARDDFEAMVRRAKAFVTEGQVFQVNVSHRFGAVTTLPALDLYARLRAANPAPFSAYFDPGPMPEGVPDFQVLSSSPERLFSLHNGRVEARPIAGTRHRGRDAADDKRLMAELSQDAKERAEHVMLVDLARNDLGRVCRFGSVAVPSLAHIETYRTVHHLVSLVEGRLRPDADALDVLRALFPGGTITGAPKVRAMELIEQLEPVRRGIYTGSLGWWSDQGDADFNILIRTLVRLGGARADDARVLLQVGAGIVEDSNPGREHAETLAKAEGMLAALREVDP